MRLALVSQEYPPETAHGGIGSQTWLKAHGLAARGHEVHVVSHSVNGERSERADGNVTVHRIPWAAEGLVVASEIARWVAYSAEVAAAVAGLHAHEPLDLVEFPEWGAEGYVHLLNQTEWSRVPTVIQLHGPLVMFADTVGWPEKDSELYRVGTHMEGTCLRLADAVYSSSRCSARWCAESYGLEVERIPVLHMGVDTELFRPAAEPASDRLTVAFVGKIERNKGVEQLVDAACGLAGEIPDLRLILIGKGSKKLVRELEDRAADQVGEGLVEFRGHVAREELPRHLGACHLFAAPSVYEGGPGLVYLEAMACGLPVIACSGSGAEEVVREGETGLLVPPADPGALVEALRRLLSDRKERQAMGRRARQYAVEEVDSRRAVERLEAIYTAVIEGRSDWWQAA